MEDKDIASLYWARDEAAIRATADKYEKHCYSIAFNILRNEESTRESVNDAYLNAWNSMPPHRPAILSAYLGKSTRFICLKRWRDARAQKRGGGEVMLAYEELSDCISDGGDLCAGLEAKELARSSTASWRPCPPRSAGVFICRYWYFDSISSIAGQFGFSESKVKSMLFRIRAKLRSKLRRGCF